MVKSTKSSERKKTVCPISRVDFLKHGAAAVADARAKLAALSIEHKEFGTGSFGFGANDKVTVTVNGVPVKCQVTMSMVVIGSKEIEV